MRSFGDSGTVFRKLSTFWALVRLLGGLVTGSLLLTSSVRDRESELLAGPLAMLRFRVVCESRSRLREEGVICGRLLVRGLSKDSEVLIRPWRSVVVS
jgi:hypothetical protein